MVGTMKKFYFILILVFLFISCSSKKNIDDNTIYVNLGGEPKTIDPALNITLQGSTYVTHLFECLTTKYKEIELANILVLLLLPILKV